MIKVFSCLLLALVLNVGTVSMEATPATPSTAVRVDYSSRTASVTVEITEASPLGMVLQELCVRSAAHCEGIQQLTDPVAPTRISGVWSEVVSKLMEGTRMNFAVVPASSLASAQLIVQGPALSPDQSKAVAGLAGQAAATDTSPAAAIASNAVTGPDTPQMPSSQSGGESNFSNSMSAKQADSFAPQRVQGGIDAASETSIRAMYAESPGGQLPSVLPILGANGQPMPRDSQVPTVLPFVDSHGNPMQAAPTPPTTPVLLRFTDPNFSPR